MASSKINGREVYIMFQKRTRAISFILSLILVLTSSQVFAESLSKIPVDGIYKELYENDGVYTYYYQDYNKNEVISISSSEQAGIKVFYNDGNKLYEIQVSDLNLKLDNSLRAEYQFEKMISKIANNKSEVNLIPYELNIERVSEVKNNEISPMGITAASQYLRSITGFPYSDKLIASATIDGYYAQVFEARDHSIYELNAFLVFAGELLSAVTAGLAISPAVAISLGIATVVKEGIEYIKQPYTILEYVGTVHYYRDADVNGRTCHQVQRRYVYRILENDGIFEDIFQFGDEDPYFGNTNMLMQIAVDNYF